MKKIFIQLVIATIVLIPAIAWADTFGAGLLNQSVEGVGLEKSLETSVASVISTVSTVVGTIFLILTVAAGIMWMTAAGNEDRITKAKQILVAATIGLFIVMSAYTITYFVTKKVGAVGGGDETTCSCAGCFCSGVTQCTADVGTALTGSDCPGSQVCCQPNKQN